MPRLPKLSQHKKPVGGDSASKKGLPLAAPTAPRKTAWQKSLRTFALCSLLLMAITGYFLFRLCQTPDKWPLFPLAEVGLWPLEQKLYNSLSTDRASTLEVSIIDINRHLARHLLAHSAIGSRSPALEAIHLSGTATNPEIAARFRWNLFPLHLRATAARTSKENRSDQDGGYSVTQISIGTLRMPERLHTQLLKWFNPLMATLKREKYLLKRSHEISTKQDSVVFHVSANSLHPTQTPPPPPSPAKTPSQKSLEKPSQAAPTVPKAIPAVPKAERVP